MQAVRGAWFGPAGDEQADRGRVHLSVEAVKSHLRKLFVKFGLAQLPQNEKRARLADHAFRAGLVSDRDLSG